MILYTVVQGKVKPILLCMQLVDNFLKANLSNAQLEILLDLRYWLQLLVLIF